jgi:DNA repair ATPase RecN
VRTKLAFLLAALALVAGCGGGTSRLTKAQFEQHIQADGNAVQKAVAKISGTPSSLAELAKQVAAAESAVKAAADDLEKIKPPQDAEQETKTIVNALRTVDAQLQKLEQAAKKNDPVAAQVAASAIQSSPEIAAAQKAAKSLKKKGYDIGAIGS